MTTITRVTSANRDKIVSDARVGFPDNTAFELLRSSDGRYFLLVNGPTPFAGAYRIVRVKGPRWVGDNGYTFERELNGVDILVMNTAYDTGDRAFRNAQDARVAHFTNLIEKYHLDDDLLASARGSVEAATSADEVRALASLIGYLLSGYAVAAFTEAYEATLARFEVQPQEETQQEQRDDLPAEPAEHAQRQRVIDRAIAAGRRYEDDQVAQYLLLREVALDFIRSYRGTNSFVQDIAVRLIDRGVLSNAQLRGALNVMVAEARQTRAEVTRKRCATCGDEGDCPDCGKPFMDLRRNSDREIEAAGDAIPLAVDAVNEVAPAIPNGTYTVILDDSVKTYRTLRVKDCPAHFTVKPDTQLIEFLNGPDNTSDYTGFAFLAGRKVALWKKYRNARDLSAAADRLVADPMSAAAEYVKRSNRCFVCNRPLTTPESIAYGIGPICREKIGELGFAFNLSGDRDQATEHAERQTRAVERDRLAYAHRMQVETSAEDNHRALRNAQAEIDELFPE